jgi:hypothetical protein
MPPLLHGRILPEPEGAVRVELRRGVWHVRIKWRRLPDEDATWEQLEVGVGTKTRNPKSEPKKPEPEPEKPKTRQPDHFVRLCCWKPEIITGLSGLVL